VQSVPSSSRKISLSSKRNKLTNEAVLEFIDANSKKPQNNSLVTTAETVGNVAQKLKPKDVTESIQFLK
jgi:hypothetical protein